MADDDSMDGLDGLDELGLDLSDPARKLVRERLAAAVKLRSLVRRETDNKVCVIGFGSNKIPARGRVTIEQRTSLPFVSERLIVAALPDPPGWRLKCALQAIGHNILCALPIIIEGLFTRLWTWRPLYERAPDPRNVVDIQIAGVSQLAGGTDPIPASVFHSDEMAVELKLDVAPAAGTLAIVVENTSDRELDFMCAISGHVEEQRRE